MVELQDNYFDALNSTLELEKENYYEGLGYF